MEDSLPLFTPELEKQDLLKEFWEEVPIEPELDEDFPVGPVEKRTVAKRHRTVEPSTGVKRRRIGHEVSGKEYSL